MSVLFDLFIFRSYMPRMLLPHREGWSGSAMVLGKLSVPGRPTDWIIVRQGPTAIAIDAGGGYFGIFTIV